MSIHIQKAAVHRPQRSHLLLCLQEADICVRDAKKSRKSQAAIQKALQIQLALNYLVKTPEATVQEVAVNCALIETYLQ